MISQAAVATQHPAQSQSSENTAVSGIGPAIAGLFRRMAIARARARTIRALSALDDHALRDIGLTRSAIRAFEDDPRFDPRYTRF
jgi:uncharacterized protein YjiS (DUF1127 family)